MRLGVVLTAGMMSTKVIKMFEAEDNRIGKIRLEWWPEGFVLWAGGEIVWRGWDGRPVHRPAKKEKEHRGTRRRPHRSLPVER